MQNRRQASSSDFSFVDYQLQLITGISSIKIITLHRIADTDYNQQTYINPAAIDITDFPKEYAERIFNKTLPLTDLIISCGHLDIHEKAKSNKVFSFLLGHAALGRIGTHRDNQSQLNALFIENETREATFQYNYFIHSHEQYKIEFEVHFMVGQDRQFKQGEYKCVICENRTATVFCRTESLNFCDSCSLEHHRAKVMQNHQLEKLDKVNTLPLCKAHNKQYTLYCTRRHRYLCEVCLQKDSSHGGNDYPVYHLPQLYAQKKNANQSISTRQQQKLQGLLGSLHLKRQEIKQNYVQTKDYITKQYDKAMSVLEHSYSQKLGLLASDQIQLKMLHDKLEWSKTFIKFQEKNLKPCFYFQSQQNFEREISKMRIRDFEGIFEVKGDMSAEGEIFVVRKDQLYKHTYAQPSDHQLARSDYKSAKSNVQAASSRKILHQPVLYGYNQSCESVQRGQLFSSLGKSSLNFFILGQ